MRLAETMAMIGAQLKKVQTLENKLEWTQRRLTVEKARHVELETEAAQKEQFGFDLTETHAKAVALPEEVEDLQKQLAVKEIEAVHLKVLVLG